MEVEGADAAVPVLGTLEEQLAGVLQQLLTDRVGAKDAISALESVYHAAAERLRDESAHQLHRPAKLMRLKALADEMQCQASTWHLVWCLYCNDSGPAGIGGPDVQDAGDQRTYRQLLADKACMDPLLARVANVVAWLESLAADELSRQGAPRFADHDGVWIETRQQAGVGTVSELDPDAPGRQGKALHMDNAKAEDRLMLRMWQLIRAGRVRDARALCRQCGQPWRSVSLGGGGGFGPLPVGLAAAQHDDELSPEQQAQDLAIETAAGAGTLRALWKWACLTAASRTARGHSGGTAARYEAAVYGALCGDVMAVLPVCNSWEDACWAYCRAWLDLSTDQALGTAQQLPHELVSGEVLMGVLQRCGLAGGGDGAGLGSSAVDGALAVVLGGQWPVPALLQPLPAAASGMFGSSTAMGAGGGLYGGAGGGAAQISSSFSQVFDALLASPEPGIRAAGKEPLHQVQQLLVQGRLAGLTTHLHRWLVAQEAQQQQQQQEGGFPRGTAPWAPPGLPLPSAGQGQEEGQAVGEEVEGLPPRQLRMVAYAAHLLLLLEALGEQTEDAQGTLEQVRGMREQLLVLYIAGLLEAEQFLLVPQYLPLTQPTNRRLLAHELLQLLTQQLNDAAGTSSGDAAWSQADARCAKVYCSMAAWLQACLIRQQVQAQVDEDGAAADGPLLSNALTTAVGPDEVRALLVSFVDACRLSPSHGPLHRVRAARWLAYPVLYPAAADSAGGDAAAEASDASAELADPSAFADMLRLVCSLCSELALGDDVTAAAAQHLLTRVLPADLETRVARLREQLMESAAAPQGPRSPDAAMAVDQEQAAEEEAAAAEAAEAAARELDALVAELRAWKMYFELDDAMQAWQRRYEQYSTAATGLADSKQELVQGAGTLLGAMMEELLETDWLASLADPGMAWAEELAAASSVAAAVAVPEGVEVELVLSCLPDAWEAQARRNDPSQAWASGTAPFPTLKGAKLFETESRLRGALQAALQRARGAFCALPVQLVAVQVHSPEGAEGYVRVRLVCKPSAEAWHCMVDLVASLLQGSMEGLPAELILVNLQAGRATSAAICRRCCLGKVVLRCSCLRQALVALGGDGSDGEQLVRMLASSGVEDEPGSGPGTLAHGSLLEVLSQAMLQQVLKLEADTLVAVMQQQQLQQ